MTFSLSYGSLATLFVLLQGCSTTQNMPQISDSTAQQPAHVILPSDPRYQIQPGDEIEILLWEQPNFNTKTTVSNLGTIAIPLLGEIKADGMTQSELKTDLAQRLSKYIKDEINLTVAIRSSETMLVSVLGMVVRPDNYPVIDGTSIFKVISMAGGPSKEADMRGVRIYRRNSNPHYTTIDLSAYLDSGEINSAAEIYPGDMVYVPPKENAIREVSAFLRDVVLLFGIIRIFN